MKINFSLLFYLKKPKNYKSGLVPIYMRITVNGALKELSAGKTCDPERWNPKSNRLNGTKEDVRSLNAYLDAIEKRIDNAHTELVSEGKIVTADAIKNRYLGIEEETHRIVSVFRDHNDQIKALIGNGFTKGTLTKYNSTLKHLKGFLKSKYKASDLEVAKVDPHFVSQFGFYVRTTGKCANNTAVKHLKNLGKVMRICLANRWITYDPFLGHKNKVEKVVRVILTPEELQALSVKEFKFARLDLVRDVFLFCCYTGLSFIDVQELGKSEIRTGYGDASWILKKRHKTLIPTHIPLLPIAEKIVEKYQDHPSCEETSRVFPVFSNQKMNAYLKEVADLCQISKHLTFHIARHTFATTVTLGNGVPIETVSKMLGHTDIRTTQIYAKILDKKVGDDMAVLEKKLDEKSQPLPEAIVEPKPVRESAKPAIRPSLHLEPGKQEARVVKLFG